MAKESESEDTVSAKNFVFVASTLLFIVTSIAAEAGQLKTADSAMSISTGLRRNEINGEPLAQVGGTLQVSPTEPLRGLVGVTFAIGKASEAGTPVRQDLQDV